MSPKMIQPMMDIGFLGVADYTSAYLFQRNAMTKVSAIANTTQASSRYRCIANFPPLAASSQEQKTSKLRLGEKYWIGMMRPNQSIDSQALGYLLESLDVFRRRTRIMLGHQVFSPDGLFSIG
jgi:hypothetical protein